MRYRRDRRMRPALSESRNPHRLYRDPHNRVIVGVCAGLADYIGASPSVIRILALLSLFFFFPVAVGAYLLLAVILPRRPAQLYRDSDEEDFWRSVSAAPDRTFGSLRQKFRELDSRLQRMEKRVTSDDYDLRRRFADLDK